MSMPGSLQSLSSDDALTSLAISMTQIAEQNARILQELQSIREQLRAPATLAALQLPMSPAILNDLINAANIPGAATGSVRKWSMIVPAGATVTAAVPVPEGKVAVSTEAVRVSATFYSVLITASVFTDGRELTTSDAPYSLTGEDQIGFGQYYYSLNNTTFTVVNPTATATIVTLKAEGLEVDRNFFQDFYLPIVQLSYHKMRELAMSVNGGRPLP